MKGLKYEILRSLERELGTGGAIPLPILNNAVILLITTITCCQITLYKLTTKFPNFMSC